MSVNYSWPLIDTVTSDYIITAVRRRGMIPNSESALTDEDILAFADEELLTYILPLLITEGVGEYCVRREYQDIEAGKSHYLLPDDAAVSKLRDLQILQDGRYVSAEYVEPERQDPQTTWINADSQTGYTFEGEFVVLRPTPTADVTDGLLFKYYQRPGTLVKKVEAGRISFINDLELTVTPAGLFGASVDATVDIIRGRPGFGTLHRNVVVSVGPGGDELTFSSADDLTDVTEGDYVCLPGEAPFPQVPKELHPILVQRVVARCLEALGDPRFQAALQVVDSLIPKTIDILTPRGEGTGSVIINQFGPGWRRRGSRF